MIRVVKTDSLNKNFIALVTHLDSDLALRDGEDHSFYAQFNSIANLKYVIVLYYNEVPIGCGAIKQFDDLTAEVKRMFVSADYRGKGFATRVLDALESWALELGYKALILETGFKQPEAIALYKKIGFSVIPNYGQYIGIDKSVCFQKIINEPIQIFE